MSPEDAALLRAFSDAAAAIAPLDARRRLRVINALCVLVKSDMETKLDTAAEVDDAADTITDVLLKDTTGEKPS